MLDPSIKIEDWTPEENIRLKELVVKHGSHRWAAVASEMGCRTDNQCFRCFPLPSSFILFDTVNYMVALHVHFHFFYLCPRVEAFQFDQ